MPPFTLIAMLIAVSLVAGSGAAPGDQPRAGLVAAYSFDAGSGSTVADVSGQGNTGSISGATWTTTGKTGTALSFDGVNDMVSIADSAALDLTTGMTLEAWVRPTVLEMKWRTAVVKENGRGIAYSLYANERTGLPVGQVNIDGEQNATGSPLTLNAWTHLATTFDGATLRLYKNGVLAGSRAVGGSIPTSTGLLRIGGNSVWSEWFAGQIDDVRVYNRALSATELQTDMNTPVAAMTVDSQPPSAPTGLRVSGRTETTVTLAVDPSTDNVGVAGYGYYRGGTLVGTAAGTTYTFTGLLCGQNYTLSVDAYDAKGNRSTASGMSASTAACAQPVRPAVAEYSFDAGSGTALRDASGNGNNGSISGATWSPNGKFGGSLSFDGVNDLVTVADAASLDLTQKMTLEAWVKPTSAGSSWRTVVMKERDGDLVYGLYAHNGSTGPSANAYVSDAEYGYAVGPAFSLGAWTHLATTFDGSTLRVFVNGAQVASDPLTGSIATSSSPLRIGGNDVWDEWFAGEIDNLRIYDRTLTGAEIQKDMTTAVTENATADTSAPTAPSAPNASGRTQTSITLSWDASSDNVGVAGYGLYRDGAGAGSTAAATRSFTFSGLTCGTSYSLAVDAHDVAGNRSSRTSLTASTTACAQQPADSQAPSAPASLTITAGTADSISVSWSASTDNVGVTGYGLYRNGTSAGSTAAATRTYTYAGLTCGTSYTLAVDAVDAAGNRSGKASLTTSTAACPSAPPPPPPPSGGAASVFVSPSGSDTNACSQAAPCKTFDRAYRAASCGATVSLAGGSYPTQTINAPEKECSSYITFTPAAGAVVTTQTVTIRSGDWIKFLGNRSNFLMRDGGGQGSTSGFYLSPTGVGLAEPVDHIWVEGLDFETFLIRGSDDVTFKNNDIGPGKSNHYDEKLWVSVGHNGSNYVNNYSTNLVCDGNLIHGFTREACASSGCHVECLTMEAENFTIKNNQFLDCDIFGIILSQDEGFSSKGTENVIEDNIIHCCKTTSGYALALGDTEPGSLVTIRRNEIRGSVTTALGGSLGTIRTCANTGNIPTNWKGSC